jgi:hypothetical protein
MSQLETYARTIVGAGAQASALGGKTMIRLTERNKPTVQAMLTAVNGRHTAHVLDNADQIYLVASEAEKELAALKIPLIKRVGAEYHFWSGSTLARAYKYRVNVNVVMLIRNTQGWILEHLAITERNPDDPVKRALRLTQEQDKIAIRAFREARNYCVLPPEERRITVLATEAGPEAHALRAGAGREQR